MCSTVNVFNVYYLEELANWINTQDFNFIYWNMMHEVYYFSIATLPELAKSSITDRLTNAHVNDSTRKEFDKIVDFMNNGAALDGNMLRMRIADLDRKRKQNLCDIESEFAKLIGYNGPT